jgi:hypothetical protein
MAVIVLDMDTQAKQHTISSRSKEFGQSETVSGQIGGGVQRLLPLRQSSGIRDAMVEHVNGSSL